QSRFFGSGFFMERAFIPETRLKKLLDTRKTPLKNISCKKKFLEKNNRFCIYNFRDQRRWPSTSCWFIKQ
ncbi:MAG: hypothetical protein IJ242_11755, partial [Clostridia bacterium]|nr:hypothetical protein [Clostridia bacterium]